MNHYEPLLTTINHYEPLWTTINHYEHTGDFRVCYGITTNQPLSLGLLITINHYQPLWTSIKSPIFVGQIDIFRCFSLRLEPLWTIVIGFIFTTFPPPRCVTHPASPWIDSPASELHGIQAPVPVPVQGTEGGAWDLAEPEIFGEISGVKIAIEW